MKVAFDVKGTLDGPKKVELRYLLNQLYEAGYEIFIWSNSFSYAYEEANLWISRGVNVTPVSKYSKHQAEEQGGMMDVAFEDDTSQTYLAAKKIIFVHEATQ